MGCIDIFWKGTLRWFFRLTGWVTNEIENLFSLMWLGNIGQDSWFRLFVAILLPDIPQLPTLQVFFKSSKVCWGSVLDSRLVWSPLDWVIRVPALAWINLMCCWLGNFTLTLWPLTTQMYKWISANLMPAFGQDPIQRGIETFLVASCYRNRRSGSAWWVTCLIWRPNIYNK